MPFGFGRNVVGGGFADAIAAAIGGAPDSALQHMITPLNMLQTAAMLAGGSPNVTPAPQMPMSAAAQQVANRVAPQPTTTAGRAARFLTSMAVPVPGPAKEKLAAQAGEELVPKILAYHGSPHTFDKFDTAKIGTGEGAQAYGHGLYFAENEGTAQSYRDTLSRRHGDFTFDGKPLQGRQDWYDLEDALNKTGDWRTAKLLKQFPNSGQDAADFVRTQREWHRNDPEMVDAIQKFADRANVNLHPGSMYQVGINAHPDHFLDWDKPLSREYVEQKLAAFPDVVAGDAKQRAFLGEDKGYTGRAAYAKAAGWNQGADLSPPNAADVSRRLSEAGIPGIKYLDQGSRTAGDGTRNYVVFDPANIEILKRYGLAATLMGGAGAAAATAPSQSAPTPTRFGF